MPDSLEQRLAEFDANIWNHAVDAYQVQFDAPLPLLDAEAVLFEALFNAGRRLHVGDLPPREFDQFLRELLLGNPDFVDRLVQWLGLTRNKVVGDLRAGAQAQKLGVRKSSLTAAISDDRSWPLVATYFRSRIVALVLALGDRKGLRPALTAINLVTWPGYIRQERAKRMGHEAERRAAEILHALEIPFAPAEKRDNPLYPDVQIKGVSFDLVIPSAEAPSVVVKSTVHTANIGQYGESKDHLEMVEAGQVLASFKNDERPLLIACVDGVGFYSNRAGLSGVLRAADEFFQFKTIWKLVAIAADRTGKRVQITLPEESIGLHAHFLKRLNSGNVRIVRATKSVQKGTLAGEASIILTP